MLVLHANELLRNVTEFAELIVASRKGISVQLWDVASVKDSVETVRPYANLNGEASIALAILRQLGANTVRVVDSATHALVKIKEHAKVARQRPTAVATKGILLLIGIVKKNAIMMIDSMATDPSPRPRRLFPEFQPPM